MRVENAKWEPLSKRGIISDSVRELYKLRVGDVKRIVHDDVACSIARVGHVCTVAQAIGRLRRKRGWGLDYYHEKRGILIVRRTK